MPRMAFQEDCPPQKYAINSLYGSLKVTRLKFPRWHGDDVTCGLSAAVAAATFLSRPETEWAAAMTELDAAMVEPDAAAGLLATVETWLTTETKKDVSWPLFCC